MPEARHFSVTRYATQERAGTVHLQAVSVPEVRHCAIYCREICIGNKMWLSLPKNAMSYTNLLYHIIFRTKDSLKTINLVNAPLLYNYIFDICRNKNCKLYRIGGVTDHIHIFAGLPPTLCVSDFVKLIKTESNKFMKNHRSEFPKFGGWGTGYCALTYSSRDREMIINYIKQQPEHHLGLGYADELRALLEENDVSYNLDYFDKD